HTFTRTKTFLQEFADSLNLADTIYLCDIFGSTRENSGNLTIHDLQNLIPNSTLLELSETEKLFKHRNSVLLFMGAGDIQKFQQSYEKHMAKKQANYIYDNNTFWISSRTYFCVIFGYLYIFLEK